MSALRRARRSTAHLAAHYARELERWLTIAQRGAFTEGERRLVMVALRELADAIAGRTRRAPALEDLRRCAAQSTYDPVEERANLRAYQAEYRAANGDNASEWSTRRWVLVSTSPVVAQWEVSPASEYVVTSFVLKSKGGL